MMHGQKNFKSMTTSFGLFRPSSGQTIYKSFINILA